MNGISITLVSGSCITVDQALLDQRMVDTLKRAYRLDGYPSHPVMVRETGRVGWDMHYHGWIRDAAHVAALQQLYLETRDPVWEAIPVIVRAAPTMVDVCESFICDSTQPAAPDQ